MDRKIALEIAIDAVRRRKAEVQQQYRLRLREFDEAIHELEKMKESFVRVVADEFSEEAILTYGERSEGGTRDTEIDAGTAAP